MRYSSQRVHTDSSRRMATRRERGGALLSAVILSLLLWSAPLLAQDQAPIRVSQDHAWPPFSYLNADGEPEGLLIDLWQALAEVMDRPVEFLLVDWPESIEQVRDGRADIHGGLFASPERAEFLTFTEPVVSLSLDRYAEPGAFHPLTLQYAQHLHAAVSQGQNTELLGQVNAALLSLNPETNRRIQQRWLLSEPVEVIPGWVWPTVLSLVGVLLASLVSLLIWQRGQLRRTLRVRTRDLQESETMFRKLAESAAVGIYIVRQTRIEFANPAMSELLGYSIEELVGERFDRFIHRDDAPQVLALSHAHMKGEQVPKQHSFRVVRLDGSVRHVQVTADRILLNHEPCIAGTVVDVTEHLATLEAMASEAQFNQLVASISSSLLNATGDNIDQQIDLLLEQTGTAFQADRAYLFRFDDAVTHMTNTHEWCRQGVQPMIDQIPELSIREYHWWREQMLDRILRGQVLNIGDVHQLPAEAAAEKALLEGQGVESMLCIPITTLKRTIGFIGFDSLTPRSWPQDQAEKLRTLSDLLSDALSRVQTAQTLTQSALTDPLTGLYNRRHLAGQLNLMFQHYRQSGQPFSVMVLDIDHFKALNDTHGHAVGDDVLRALSNRLSGALRQNDVIVRYGGEEFVVVLAGCDLDVAMQQAERLLAQVRAEPFQSHGQTHAVTVSAGVASVTELESARLTTTNLIELADQRLYEAKRAGRDRAH